VRKITLHKFAMARKAHRHRTAASPGAATARGRAAGRGSPSGSRTSFTIVHTRARAVRADFARVLLRHVRAVWRELTADSGQRTPNSMRRAAPARREQVRAASHP
jgi:hypothetical protein